jgi:Fur family peroxide stress response transcriptional regulator
VRSRSRPRPAPAAARRPRAPYADDLPARMQSLVERCREAGMSVTPQRLAIYRALVETEDHPSPEAIYERVRPALPSLSLATIYKTLEALARLGLVHELPSTGNSRRYDANTARHHHLVCMRCDRVIDYADPALDRIAPPRRLPGFTAHHLSISIHGLCETCAAARDDEQSITLTHRRRASWPGI